MSEVCACSIVRTLRIWATVQPTHALDITAVWDLKRKAVEAYESQLRYNDLIYMGAGLNGYRMLYKPSVRYEEAFQAGKTA